MARLDHRRAGGPERTWVDMTVVHCYMSGDAEWGCGERCLSASLAEMWLFSSL